MLALRSNRGTPFGVRAAPSKLPVSSVGLHGLRPCVRYKLQPPATNRKGRDGVPVTCAAQAKVSPAGVAASMTVLIKGPKGSAQQCPRLEGP
jgi:hypothetical protein